MSLVSYLYVTENMVNNKVYVGVHTTKDINDGYIGSGTLLKRAIKKHGRHNFETEIIEIFESEEDAYEMEKHIVDTTFISLDWTYNISLGGHGGNTMNYRRGDNHHNRIKGLSKEHRLSIGISLKGKSHKGGNSKPVIHIPTGIEYKSLKEGCIILGFNYQTIHYRVRLNSKKNEFKYI